MDLCSPYWDVESQYHWGRSDFSCNRDGDPAKEFSVVNYATAASSRSTFMSIHGEVVCWHSSVFTDYRRTYTGTWLNRGWRGGLTTDRPVSAENLLRGEWLFHAPLSVKYSAKLCNGNYNKAATSSKSAVSWELDTNGPVSIICYFLSWICYLLLLDWPCTCKIK